MITKVTTVELKVGMFVAELDRPWTETPFLLQGFVIETDKQILALQKYCKYVIIDRARSTGKEYAPPPKVDIKAPARSPTMRATVQVQAEPSTPARVATPVIEQKPVPRRAATPRSRHAWRPSKRIRTAS